MAGAIATLEVRVDRMRAAAQDPMLLATDLAEALVRAGVPFREAHEAVGRVVAHCVEKDVDLRTLSREDLAAFHSQFPGDAKALVSLERALEERKLVGGTARATVAAALEAAERELDASAAALDLERAEDEQREDRVDAP
jgi:argininosuccinate lyase